MQGRIFYKRSRIEKNKKRGESVKQREQKKQKNQMNEIEPKLTNQIKLLQKGKASNQRIKQQNNKKKNNKKKK